MSRFVYPDILMRIRCTRSVDPAFVNAVLNSAYIRVQTELATRTTVGTYKVNNQQVRELLLVVPPADEQRVLVGYLGRLRDRVGVLVAHASRQLDHLREYRQALITAAVTGQLDVTSESAA